MAKKVHKDKEGNVRSIELTDKDAKDLYKDMEKEASKYDEIPCDCMKDAPAGARRVRHTIQKNGMWKCNRCGHEKDDFEVAIIKGDEWYELEKGFEIARDKTLGDYKSMV